MSFALINSGAVKAVGRLPNSARRLDTGQWVMGLTSAPTALVEACGWFPVTDEPPTYNTTTEVLERGAVEVVDGRPLRAYTVRAKTAAELAEDAEVADRNAKRINVANAVATLRQWADDAENTDVTATNAVQVLNVLVGRLGVFFDRFADLIEAQRLDVD